MAQLVKAFAVKADNYRDLLKKETIEPSRKLSSDCCMPMVAQACLHYTGTNTKLVTFSFFKKIKAQLYSEKD